MAVLAYFSYGISVFSLKNCGITILEILRYTVFSILDSKTAVIDKNCLRYITVLDTPQCLPPEIIDVKNHIPGNVIGNAERNMTEVMKFTKQQKMELNLKKCKEMLIDLRRNKTAIPLTEIENNIIERVNSYKVLGLWIDDNLKWNTNTEKIIKKAAKRLFLLKIIKSYGASTDDMKDFTSQ